jgi:branched-subunit amino acid ABC-type transport system permease component
VITVAIVFVLQAAAGFVTALPIFGNIQDRTNEELSGGAPVNVPFSGFHFQVGSLPLRFGFAHLFAIAMCLVALLLLSAFFRYTRIGIAVRAAAENSERAAMLGINVGTLSLAVWSIAGALGGLSVILAGTVQRQFSFFAQSFDLLVVALAAAVIARMRSIPVAVASAVGITVLQEALRYSYFCSRGTASSAARTPRRPAGKRWRSSVPRRRRCWRSAGSAPPASGSSSSRWWP